MRSWRFHRFGGLSALQMEEVPVPAPADRECLVKIAYAGLNPADRLLLKGRYPTTGTPPFSVGRDGSGTVVQAGSSGRFKSGDRVVFLRGEVGIHRDGTLADFTAVDEAHIAPLPHWWTMADGAAGPLVLLTSWQALNTAADLRSGETVLITGASGGVGVASLLLAGTIGAKTIALSRNEEKRSTLLKMGADHVLDPRDKMLAEQVKAVGGADVVVESIGGDLLPKVLKAANPCARICIVGALGGIDCRIDPTVLIFKRLQLHGIQVGMYSDSGVQRAWREICDRIEPKRSKVRIDRIFPFEQVPEAFEHLRKGPMGKVVVGPIQR